MQSGVDKNKFEIDELCSLKGLQVIPVNVRSLYHKIDVLRNDLTGKHVGVIGVSVMWFHDLIPDNTVQIENYHLIRNDMFARE